MTGSPTASRAARIQRIAVGRHEFADRRLVLAVHISQRGLVARHGLFMRLPRCHRRRHMAGRLLPFAIELGL